MPMTPRSKILLMSSRGIAFWSSIERDRLDGQDRVKESAAATAQRLWNLNAHDAEVEDLVDEFTRNRLLVVHRARSPRRPGPRERKCRRYRPAPLESQCP